MGVVAVTALASDCLQLQAAQAGFSAATSYAPSPMSQQGSSSGSSSAKEVEGTSEMWSAMWVCTTYEESAATALLGLQSCSTGWDSPCSTPDSVLDEDEDSMHEPSRLSRSASIGELPDEKIWGGRSPRDDYSTGGGYSYGSSPPSPSRSTSPIRRDGGLKRELSISSVGSFRPPDMRRSRFGRDGAPPAGTCRFRCRFPGCSKLYASTDAVRKHCRKRHGEWLKKLDIIATQERQLPKPALYCVWGDKCY